MAVTTKKTFPAANGSTATFGPIGVELNNQDDLDVYITLSGSNDRVLQLKQSTASTADSNHPQVNDTTGLYFPAVASGTSLTNYAISADNNNIIFNANVPSGAIVSIERRTRDESGDYTNFAGGSTIRSTDLNSAFDEVRMTAVEARNKAFDLENTYNHYGTGNISVNAGKKIIFEGATEDEHETEIVVTDPTADRTITIPNETGTLITDGATDWITADHIQADAVGASELANDSVASANIIDGAIVNADINASADVAFTKLENLDSSKILVGNGSNKAAEVAMSGDITINNAGVTIIGADAVQIANISDTETSVTANSDAKIPTSKAVADYVQTKIDPIGGLEVIDDDESFPNTLPATGVIISIKDAGGLIINGSGVSTNGDTLDNTTVTINGFPSDLQSTTIAAGVGLMVQSTGSSQTYNYHKALLKEADLVNLSTDINDFGNRYRVGTKTADNDSSNDDGDLFFDTSANKMYVYDGAYDAGGSWGEVTSTGEFKILGIKDNGQAHNGSGPTFNGSNDQYDLFEGTNDANITQASQLIVSLNGVIQKPNDGSWSGSNEGFHLDGADGIRFCDPPASGSTLFVTKCGSATAIGVPADNTITAGKTDISIVQGDLIYGDGTDSWTRLAKGTAGKVLKMNSGATAPEWADDIDTDTLIGGATGADFNDDVKVRFGTGNDMQIYGHSNNSGQITNANGGIGIKVGASPYQVSLSGWNTSGTPANNLTIVANSGANTYADLRYDGNVKLQTTSTGISATGAQFTGDVTFDNATNAGKDITWDESDDALEFADNVKAAFGNDKDFTISFNTSNIILENDPSNAGGDFYLYTDDIIFGNVAKNATTAQFNSGGSCDLYFNGTKEFETKAGGVQLNGCSHSNINHSINVSGSTTLDFSVADLHIVSLVGNATLANPSTEVAGQSGSIFVEQDGTGSRTLAYGTQFKWAGGAAPTLSTAANAVDRIDYIVRATDIIHCVISLDVK